MTLTKSLGHQNNFVETCFSEGGLTRQTGKRAGGKALDIIIHVGSQVAVTLMQQKKYHQGVLVILNRYHHYIGVISQLLIVQGQ